MSTSITGKLCFHGAVIMFFAFVSGMMIGMVAVGQVEGNVADWKLAHMEALINSILLLAVAGWIGKIVTQEKRALVAAYCLIAMGYCNTVFGFMRGMTGAAGYQFDDSLANNITAFAGMLGVPLGVVAFVIIILGAARVGKA